MVSDLQVKPIRNRRVAEFGKIRTDCTFRHKSGFWRKFAMTSPESLHINISINELSFPLVTHIDHSNTRFGSDELLKTEQGAELFWAERMGE
jgi:hypothetical protein